jgi:hypothetical protein
MPVARAAYIMGGSDIEIPGPFLSSILIRATALEVQLTISGLLAKYRFFRAVWVY